MKCLKCGNTIYNLYSAQNSKYTRIDGKAYCPKCDKVYNVTLSEQ